MPADDRRQQAGWPKGGDYCPHLALVTGALEPAWQTLDAEHADYDRWHGVGRYQEEWSRQMHSWYWREHLRLWPHIRGRATTTGLMAAHTAIWRRQGYSRTQIEAALGYRPNGAPKSLWRRAGDYQDWLASADFLERQADYQLGDIDGLRLIAWHEELYAGSVDPSIPTGGLRLETGLPVVDPSAPDAADQARRWVRRRWRTPRVIALDGWGRVPFGLPEPFSEAILYDEFDRQKVAQAAERLARCLPRNRPEQDQLSPPAPDEPWLAGGPT